MEALSPVALSVSDAAVAWVLARGCRNGPSPPELLSEIGEACQRAVSSAETEASHARRAAVRNLLRHGAYKPTGRGKPASEYLLRAAAEGSFPTISALVEINNLVSVDSLLPISLVDLDLAGTETYQVRRGRPGESYVFNPSGQILDLEDLLLLARMPGDTACATPVKDSQATKTRPETREVLAVIYAPPALASDASEGARRMAQLLETYCGAETAWGILP